jgi:hypothetical protein
MGTAKTRCGDTISGKTFTVPRKYGVGHRPYITGELTFATSFAVDFVRSYDNGRQDWVWMGARFSTVDG